MHCIVCGNGVSNCLCTRCGFDLSLSRDSRPTLVSDGKCPQALWVKRNEIYLELLRSDRVFNAEALQKSNTKKATPSANTVVKKATASFSEPPHSYGESKAEGPQKTKIQRDPPFAEPVRKAAVQDDAESLDEVPGLVLRLFEDVKNRQSFKNLRSKADCGDKSASIALGLCFLTGRSILQDSKMGLSRIRDAANQNEPFSQYLLGMINEQRLFGLSGDPQRIYKWYSSASKLRDVSAMHRFADLMEQGTLKGTPEWIQKLRSEAGIESPARTLSRLKIEKLLSDSSRGFEKAHQLEKRS